MRTRLQRLRDAKFFSGWVTDMDPEEVRVRLNVNGQFQAGDQLLVEISGKEVTATFQAAVSVAFENQIYLSILTPVVTRPVNENPRLSVSGIFGVVVHEEVETEARVVDISAGGMGFIARRSIPKNETIRYKLATPVGEVYGEAQVRYCRLESSGSGFYRIGCRILEQGRVEQAKWTRLLDKDAA